MGVSAANHPGEFRNRLAREASPYLRQHAGNPVDWRPWGDEAFEAARAADKPVFLSIGYSTCHWCHVMERESFENPEIARFLNEHFIPVKVDREERPDVDRIYMVFVQGATGSGGWPLSCFLTPERRPFFGGTYFPPAGQHGRPGFLALLQRLVEVWRDQRAEVLQSAANLQTWLASACAPAPSAGGDPLDVETLRDAARAFQEIFDPVHGGFGGAPKFPQPSVPSFLLACARRFQDPAAAGQVFFTCDRMAAGGIHDQVGGGFSRYSVDGQWRVPHFEKMLYDNAQLASLYLDAFLAGGSRSFADVARDILGYVQRDLTHPEGAFYSAEDADSEGREGKFYCWTRAELASLLLPPEMKAVVECLGVTDEGNFTDHSDPSPLPGQNVLFIARAPAGTEEAASLASALGKLRAVRAGRVRPGLDDKILVSWNGLMISAFARAGAVLEDDALIGAAERAADFIAARLWDPVSKTLYHRWREGERDSVQLLNACAFFLRGLVDLYECTLAPGRLVFAIQVAESMIARFHDAGAGGFWQSSGEELIVRVKEDQDGAEPSGNSAAIHGLLRLAALTGRDDFRVCAEKGLRLFAGALTARPHAVPLMLSALDIHLAPPCTVAVTGDPADPAAKALIRAAQQVYRPELTVAGTAGPVAEFARLHQGESDRPRAWVCSGTACHPAVSDPGELRRLLARA